MTDFPVNSDLADAVAERFTAEFGAGARLFFAPGRVNLVGAHLDYNGGDVLPMAIDRGVYAALRLRDDGAVRLRSLDVEPPIDVAMGSIAEFGPEHGWARYPLGVAAQIQAVIGSDRGFEAVFAGDVPIASGLSSSAALEVATALALDHCHDAGLSRERLALIAHRAENETVGVPCGIMDQFASALCRPGHLLWLHCADQTHQAVPLAGDLVEVLVLDTRKPRELAASAYEQRVRECGVAFARLCELIGERPCLAAFRPAEVAAAGDQLDGVPARRARHVASEMRRVTDAVGAVLAGDMDRLGEQLDASHFSARDDYEVSCRELDVITEAARERDDVFGARLTGAGFGGCAVALVRPGASHAVAEHVAARYRAEFDRDPAFHVLRAGAGAREL